MHLQGHGYKNEKVYLINSSEFLKFTLFSEETPVTDFFVFLSMDYDTGYEEPTVLVATEKIQIDKKFIIGQPYVIFPKKTYSVRWREWEYNEIDYNLYPCEFWEVKLHVNK